MIDQVSSKKTHYYHVSQTNGASPTIPAGSAQQVANRVLETPSALLEIECDLGLGYLVLKGAWNWFSGSPVFTSDVITSALIGGVNFVTDYLVKDVSNRKVKQLFLEYKAFCYKNSSKLHTISERKKFLAAITTSVEKMTRRQLEYGFGHLGEEKIVNILKRAISEPIFWPYAKRLFQSAIQPTVKDQKLLLHLCIESGYVEGISLLAAKGFKGWNEPLDAENGASLPLYVASLEENIEMGIELARHGAKDTPNVWLSLAFLHSSEKERKYEKFVSRVEKKLKEMNKSNAYLVLCGYELDPDCTLNKLPPKIIVDYIIPEVLKVQNDR